MKFTRIPGPEAPNCEQQKNFLDEMAQGLQLIKGNVVITKRKETRHKL